MRVNNRNVLGTLLHLPRFHSVKLSKILNLIIRLLQILKVPFQSVQPITAHLSLPLSQKAPNHMLDYGAIREQLCTSVQLKKILATNELRQYVEIEHVNALH